MNIVCSSVSLRGLPLFSLLAESELASIQPQTQLRNYSPGNEIVKRGDRTDGIHVLIAGAVDVLLKDLHGHKVIVDSLRANETFNELALFSDTPSALSFVAARASQVLFIPRHALADALVHNCKLASFVATTLAQRLQHCYRKLAVFGLDDVYARVLDVILSGGYEKDGAWHVGVGASAMAVMVGSSREMVSRVTRDLVERNLVQRHKRKLVVHDRGALRNWAEQRRAQPVKKKKRPALHVRAVAPAALATEVSL